MDSDSGSQFGNGIPDPDPDSGSGSRIAFPNPGFHDSRFTTNLYQEIKVLFSLSKIVICLYKARQSTGEGFVTLESQLNCGSTSSNSNECACGYGSGSETLFIEVTIRADAWVWTIRFCE